MLHHSHGLCEAQFSLTACTASLHAQPHCMHSLTACSSASLHAVQPHCMHSLTACTVSLHAVQPHCMHGTWWAVLMPHHMYGLREAPLLGRPAEPGRCNAGWVIMGSCAGKGITQWRGHHGVLCRQGHCTVEARASHSAGKGIAQCRQGHCTVQARASRSVLHLTQFVSCAVCHAGPCLKRTAAQALPEVSSCCLKHAAAQALPEARSFCLKHAAAQALPEVSSCCLKHAAAQALPEARSFCLKRTAAQALPEARSGPSTA